MERFLSETGHTAKSDLILTFHERETIPRGSPINFNGTNCRLVDEIFRLDGNWKESRKNFQPEANMTFNGFQGLKNFFRVDDILLAKFSIKVTTRYNNDLMTLETILVSIFSKTSF